MARKDLFWRAKPMSLFRPVASRASPFKLEEKKLTVYLRRKEAMITLDLEPEEQQILVEILQSTLSDLGYEIGNTDQMDYRDVLKKRKAVLAKVLKALQ
jgi:hypothetical protein